MPARELAARANLEQYRKQAKDLLKGCKAGDPKSLRRMWQYHNRSDKVSDPTRVLKFTLADAQFVIAREHGFDSWPKFSKRITKLTGGEALAPLWKSAEGAVVAGDVPTLERLLREHEPMFRTERPQSSWLGGLTPDYSAGDARSIIVRNHFFESWDQFATYAAMLKDRTSAVAQFERTADAVVTGEAASLQRSLRQKPDLVRARSTRTHHSTLLHYVGANGVEGFRQHTPQNAVQIAEILLKAGAEVDAVADMYQGGCTTLGLVATSIHPKVAGVLHTLIDVLLAHGARIDARGSGRGHALVNGCLANGRDDAAEFLASRGAPLDLEGAAGVGRLDLVKTFFNPDGSLKETATMTQLKDGFTWACEYGRTDVVEYLLDYGIDVGELLPRPHGQTGLHWAAYGGHVDTVKALLKRRAPVDMKDRDFSGTPLAWALHGWESHESGPSPSDSYYEVVALLVAAGAPVETRWLSDENVRADPRMFAALTGKTHRP
jgi:ankyrin repeat protein